MDSQHIVLIGLGVAALLFVLLAYKALTRSRGKFKESSSDTTPGPSLDSADEARAREQEAAERSAMEAAEAAREAQEAYEDEAAAKAAAEAAAEQEAAAIAAAEEAARLAAETSTAEAAAAEAAAKEAAERAAAEKAAAEAAAAEATRAADEKAMRADEAQRKSEENAAAFKQGLERTRSSLLGKLSDLFGRTTKIDDDVLDELEEVLISADVGVKLTMSLVDELRAKAAERAIETAADVQNALKELLLEGSGNPSRRRRYSCQRGSGAKDSPICWR